MFIHHEQTPHLYRSLLTTAALRSAPKWWADAKVRGLGGLGTAEGPRDFRPMSRGISLHAATPSSLKLSAFRLRIAQRLLLLIAWCFLSSSRLLNCFTLLPHRQSYSHHTAKMTERLKSIVAQISPSTSGLSTMYAIASPPSA